MRLFLLLGSLLLPASLNAAERIVERVINVNPDVHFSLASHRGSVEIMTGNVNTVEITALIRHEDEDVLDDVSIDIDSSSSRVRVSTKFGRQDFPFFSGIFGMDSFFRNTVSPDISFRIVIPENASLTLNGHRSALTVQAPAGRVDITSHRGDGDIRNVHSDIEINTHRGNFDVEIVELHDVDLQSHRGDIRLQIANASDFTLRGETHRGNMRFTGRNIETHYDERKSEVRYTDGTGRNFIDFNTHRGNVRINFLD